ncbi:MAG: DUF4340 domain-containing protein [Clostridia bacterium]|nr:DUF4340 domain-containing protein [Clostridia bacterium]
MTNGKAINESTARLRRRRSVAKMQRNWIIALAVLTVLLIAAFIVVDYIVNIVYFEDYDGAKYQIKQKNGIYVMCDSNGDTLDLSVSADTSKNTYIYVTELGTEVKVDPDTGINTVYSVIDTVDGEEVGVSDRIQMFKQIKQADIDKIEVHNAHGAFTFYVDKDGDFQIQGHEGVPYSQVMFSSLAVSCGYTLSTRKIQDPIKDENGLYTEYGLAPEKRVDENGNEYDYSPYWYRITDINGNSHTVYIGDAVPSNTGYYVKLTDRDAVYVMNYSIDGSYLGMYDGQVYDTIESVLHVPIEKFVTPMVTYPMELNNYFDVRAFALWEGDKFNSIPENITDEELEKLDLDPIVSFTYWDLEERTGTFYANTPYILAYPEGYVANDNAIDTTLQSFYTMSTLGVVKLGITEEDLKTYNLVEPEYVVYFDFQGKYEHLIFISAETERGTRYMTSGIYDIIVEVDRSKLPFLNYTRNDWVNDLYFSMNLAWAKNIEVEYDGKLYTFELDNSLSDSMSNPTYSEDAKKKGTITSDKMTVHAYDSEGNTMDAISQLTVVDKKGFTWTIDHESVKAYNSAGERVNITGGYYAYNARDEKVIVLEGYIDTADYQIYVTANQIRIQTHDGALVKEYMRYGMSNLRKFFSALLYASKQGSVHDGTNGLTEEEVNAILANRANYDVRIKVETTYVDPDTKKNVVYEYKYYNYSERQAMITVNDGDGEFRVLRSFTKKVAEDAGKVISGAPIKATDKYS